MSPTVHDAATGWSYSYDVGADGIHADWGLVLRDVQHDGHNFAKEIRLLGLRMIVEAVDPGDIVVETFDWFYPLAQEHFDFSEIKELTPVPTTAPKPKQGTFQYLKESEQALYLESYFQVGKNHVACGLRCNYRTREDEFEGWPNAEFSALRLAEIFLFSRYADSPPHEPSGNLHAARCHPMVTFELIPNPKLDRRHRRYRVRSIRFDYRLHLYIDRHYDLKKNAALSQIGNHAGLFRDEETLAVGSATVKTFTSGGVRPAISQATFASVEKPLVLEVLAPALAMGLSVYDDSTTVWSTPKACWDNIHWWGARGKGRNMISTPGAFHAAHMHWRWGTMGSALRSFMPTIDSTGTPDAASNHTAAGGISGALTDPGIWMQSIRIAVTKNEPSLDPSTEQVGVADLSKEDWKTLFTDLRTFPEEVRDGDDLVLWYSVEANSEVVLPSSLVSVGAIPTLVSSQLHGDLRRRFAWASAGTVFLHGLFFAHEGEPDDVLSFGWANKSPAVPGSRGALYWPDSAGTIRKRRAWFRSG